MMVKKKKKKKKKITIKTSYGWLVWFLCLMAYQPLEVI